MKSIHLLCIVLFWFMPVKTLEEVTIQLKDLVTDNYQEYTITLPQGYKRLIVSVPDMSFGETYSFQFRYPNGSVLYFGNTVGYRDEKRIEQIIGQDSGYNYLVGNVFLLDAELTEMMNIPSHWDLHGEKKNKRSWRDVETFCWAIGYDNVPQSQVELFDSVIDSFLQNYYTE